MTLTIDLPDDVAAAMKAQAAARGLSVEGWLQELATQHLQLTPTSEVTVQSAGDSEDERKRQQDWRRFVQTTAGSIDDPTFKRRDQGQLTEAEDLFP